VINYQATNSDLTAAYDLQIELHVNTRIFASCVLSSSHVMSIGTSYMIYQGQSDIFHTSPHRIHLRVFLCQATVIQSTGNLDHWNSPLTSPLNQAIVTKGGITTTKLLRWDLPTLIDVDMRNKEGGKEDKRIRG
jgi:hypothetical protein